MLVICFLRPAETSAELGAGTRRSTARTRQRDDQPRLVLVAPGSTGDKGAESGRLRKGGERITRQAETQVLPESGEQLV